MLSVWDSTEEPWLLIGGDDDDELKVFWKSSAGRCSVWTQRNMFCEKAAPHWTWQVWCVICGQIVVSDRVSCSLSPLCVALQQKQVRGRFLLLSVFQFLYECMNKDGGGGAPFSRPALISLVNELFSINLLWTRDQPVKSASCALKELGFVLYLCPVLEGLGAVRGFTAWHWLTPSRSLTLSFLSW